MNRLFLNGPRLTLLFLELLHNQPADLLLVIWNRIRVNSDIHCDI